MQIEELGDTLRARREEKNFTIEQVSRAISLRSSIIEELERGDYSKIDALLYTKNYLKRYAGYLGFTPDEVEAMIESIPVEDKSYQHLKLNTEIKNKENRRKKSFILRLYFFVVILILASVYLYFTLDKHGDFFKNGIAPTPQDEAIIDESDVPPPLTEPRRQGPSVFTEPSVVDPLIEMNRGKMTDDSNEAVGDYGFTRPIDETVEAETNNLNDADEPSPEILAEIENIKSLAKLGVPTKGAGNQQESVIAEEENLLYIETNDDCWIGLYDGSGNTPVQAIVKPGEPFRLTLEDRHFITKNGEKSMRLKFGNGRAVTELRVNGKTVDPELYTPQGKRNIITFNLNPEDYQ